MLRLGLVGCCDDRVRASRRLPEIATLRDRCRALAMIEAIVCPEWESRYYSFDTAWADGEQMASMSNGSGDEYSIVFTPAGVFIRGFDHESPMSPAVNNDELWPGLVDNIADVFLAQVNEPAFSYDGSLSATFCLWRQTIDAHWHAGNIDFPPLAGYRIDPDGSEMLLAGAACERLSAQGRQFSFVRRPGLSAGRDGACGVVAVHS